MAVAYLAIVQFAKAGLCRWFKRSRTPAGEFINHPIDGSVIGGASFVGRGREFTPQKHQCGHDRRPQEEAKKLEPFDAAKDAEQDP